MQAAAGFNLKILNSGAAGSQYDVLPGNLRVISVGCVGGLRGQPLTETGAQFGLQAADIDSGVEAAEDVEPVAVCVFQNTVLALHCWFVVEWNPESGRIAVDAVAEKSGRRNADNGEGLVLDVERGADHFRVAAVGGLPGMIAQDCDRGCAGVVVGGLQHAPGEGSDAEGREIIS